METEANTEFHENSLISFADEQTPGIQKQPIQPNPT
jgi:hypothetical protein